MNLAERDRNVIWHPFTPVNTAPEPIPIVRGEGVYLIAEDGTRYIDGMSSWWVNLHGHAHPYLAKKIAEQAAQLEHSIFALFTHEPGIRLAERLLDKAGAGFTKVFYSDNGSTSVEVAIKMCLQYWHNKNQPRVKVIAFENAYHGDTFGSMSVGARNPFSQAFDPLLFEVIRVPVPHPGTEERAEHAFRDALEKNRGEIACFIYEPLVQGAGCMRMYKPDALNRLLGLAKNEGVFCIADEVMTGFGRTGTWFASHQAGHQPDVLCLSKGITGGNLPFGATLCTEEIFSAYRTGDKLKTFFHGHSYTGNPTACAAALASFDLMEEEQTWANIRRIRDKHAVFTREISTHEKVDNVRHCGTILALDWKTPADSSYFNSIGDTLNAWFISQKIILRPLGNTVYILPPYCITDEQLDYIYAKIREALTRF
ncbi:MAG: adenosylmethionine--8-amino-7-oxononanoate transaminase [Mucilaginibacter polytrichastri]|nr:adenosylmethionine--8-amino-7-oxononanoate transaminase [Mucilaginibacter polytrichastri]